MCREPTHHLSTYLATSHSAVSHTEPTSQQRTTYQQFLPCANCKASNGHGLLQARQQGRRHQAQGGGDALLPQETGAGGARRAGGAAGRQQGETALSDHHVVDSGTAIVNRGRHGGCWKRHGARRRLRRRQPGGLVHIQGAGAAPARAHGRGLADVLLTTMRCAALPAA